MNRLNVSKLLIFILTSSCQTFSSSDNFISSHHSSTYTNSLSENKFAGYRLHQSEAESYLNYTAKSSGSKKEKIEYYESVIAAHRITGSPLSSLFKNLVKLAEVTRKSSKNAAISERSLLEISIASIRKNAYGMATFLLNDLKFSKDKKIKAGAFNALGLIAQNEGRIPEAVEFWKKSLASFSAYLPAQLNLIYTNLKYGHFSVADEILNDIEDVNWMTESAYIVSKRHSGNKEQARDICKKLLKKLKNHKPTIFNCGILEWQNYKNPKTAKSLIQRALKIPGGPRSWENKGINVLKKLRN